MSRPATTSSPKANGDIAWRSILAGLCASLIGIGLARFAYTPLLPAIIRAGWFSPSMGAYLGAANLAGYLAGALLGGPAATLMPARNVIRGAMLLATGAFFACAWPLDAAWFFAWRFASGLAGGVVMVLAAPTILPHIAPSRRGLVSGAIFMGVGLGIAASGTLVPLLLQQGVRQAWIGLGVLALILTLIGWSGWPAPTPAQAPAAHQAVKRRFPAPHLRAVYAAYGLNAFGFVPHMLFLVDFIDRGLGQGLAAGAEYWVLYGLGAVIGPLSTGHIADRTGFGPALRLAYLVEAVAIALPAFSHNAASLMISSFIVGALTIGVVPLVLGRVNEILQHHPAVQKAAWSRATISFAVMQASGAYGLSFLFVHFDGDYELLFWIGSAALILALLVDLLVSAFCRTQDAAIS